MLKRKLFIAILLPDNFIQELISTVKLNTHVEGLRWTREENLHITLFFIGFVEENKLNPIKEEIQNLSNLVNIFSISFESIKLITPQKPKMIWAQFQKNKDFQRFNEFATTRLKEIIPEFIPSHKEPIPHVTLARIKSKNGVKEIDLSSQIPHITLTVKEFYLMESKSTKEGVRYFPLEKYELNSIQ